MTDYKQLCAELLNCLNGLYEEIIDAGVGSIPDEAQDLMNRAWEAMAESEPEGPTRRQLLQLAAEFWPEGCEPAQAVPFARAVLARWGRPAPQPIPVSERLPGPEDCMANPRNGEGQWCWGWGQYSSSAPFTGRWRMLPRAYIVEESTHWLPAHALPMPVEGE
jgi:hypothetical protein